MKLSEFKNEQALDLLAELFDPASEIFSDKEITDHIRKGGSKIGLAKMIIKNHRSALIQMLAALNGKSVDEYEFNFVSLMRDVISLLSDKELMQVFSYRG